MVSESFTADPMRRAVELAASIRGQVSPNPAVGAVLTRDGNVVGEGVTQPPGGPHAEIEAIRSAGPLAQGTTLYVTLEPCSHHGRTPPCTDAIMAAGIARVVCAITDPDEHVRGSGIEQLRSAGIAVQVGSHEAEVGEMLGGYLQHRRNGIPRVTVKFAASLDGKIGTFTGDSRWISGPQTLAWAHQERTHIDAIAVGVNTILIDNPQLTARPEGQEAGAHQPLRVIVDSRGRTPLQANVLGGSSPTLVATTKLSQSAWRENMRQKGVEVALLPCSEDHVDLRALVALLGERGCLDLLVEGGGVLIGALFDAGLVDRVQAVIAPMIVGGEGAPTAVAGRGVARMADALRLDDVKVQRLGADLLVVGKVPHDQ
jgi:diaminohydroxyphosphoribosylaminopyrimidine deaminase / 5-amino-6-(5-phosphoribosylamino)uracil reductase